MQQQHEPKVYKTGLASYYGWITWSIYTVHTIQITKCERMHNQKNYVINMGFDHSLSD